jgi:WD40 repeat protein
MDHDAEAAVTGEEGGGAPADTRSPRKPRFQFGLLRLLLMATGVAMILGGIGVFQGRGIFAPYVRSYDIEMKACRIAFVSDNRHVVVADQEHVCQIDILTGKTDQEFRLGDAGCRSSLDRDGWHRYVAAAQDSAHTIVNDGACVCRWRAGDPYSPDDASYAPLTRRYQIMRPLWGMGKSWESHRFHGLAISPDGTCVAAVVSGPSQSGDVSQSIRIWRPDLGSTIEAPCLDRYQASDVCIAFTPNGRMVAVTDGLEAAFYDAETGKQKHLVQVNLRSNIPMTTFLCDGVKLAIRDDALFLEDIVMGKLTVLCPPTGRQHEDGRILRWECQGGCNKVSTCHLQGYRARGHTGD